MSIVHAALILCALFKIGVKANFHVYFEDVTIDDIDSEYFDPDNTNGIIIDNTISTNLTIVKTLPADTEARFKLSGLSMGKYTLPTGVDICMPLCDLLNEPIIMGPFFSVLGFSAENCPPEPGNYFKEGYVLPMENFPDDFPNNKYQVDVHILSKGRNILSAEIYCDIQT